MERQFSNSGLREIRCIEDGLGHSGTTKARAARVAGTIAEWGREQMVQVPAFGRHGRLAVLDEAFEKLLLVERIDDLQGGDMVLCFHQPPADTGKRPSLRR